MPLLQQTLGAEIVWPTRKVFVCVAGNIGAGKTTVAHLLESMVGLKKYEETVESNPYLPLFYSDMRAWSYKLQRYFLMTRFIAHENITMSPYSTVQDRSIYEDMEVFAPLQTKLGYFAPEQTEKYRAFCRLLYGELKPPDLLIFLKASLPVLAERIKRRNRDYERELIAPGNNYLAELQGLYDQWIDSYDLGPKIIIETDHFNFVDDLEHVRMLLESIREKLLTAKGDERNRFQ